MHSDIDPAALQSVLARWYSLHGRHLNFRQSRDPWGVLVSEVMLQQTQVSRVEPAWLAFMQRFPSPAALAASAPADALRAWAGLGYNRRAVNLWRAAVAIVERHDGRVPGTFDELRAFPGVGGYTARAVAAVAFGLPVAAVDTNVRRVVGRARWGEMGAPTAVALQSVADSWVEAAHPDRWTHAVMDIGATLCRPSNPGCGACPLSGLCSYAAVRAGATEVRAVTRGRAASVGRAATSVGAASGSAQPFPLTTRWLRGRIVDRLRAAEPGGWVGIDEPVGDHGVEAVQAAVESLVHEGLLERGEHGRVRLPASVGVPA